ncbi:MAG TPA: hypothetical protein VMX79_08020 [bacterium]|nr:hypothetical protein [bacterium]
MRLTVYLWALVFAGFSALAASGFATDLEGCVVAQLACPVKVTELVAVYGPAGAKYKPADYVNINPEGTAKLWVFAVFENATDDPITSFTFDVLVWDAGGKELFRDGEEFHFPLRGNAKSWEWSWAFDDAASAAEVVFVPRVVNFPASRKWEADEKFVELKLGELRKAD